MAQSRLDAVKDEVDELLQTDGRKRTDQLLRHRLGMARDLVEYIQIHFIDVLEADIAERRADRRRAKETK